MLGQSHLELLQSFFPFDKVCKNREKTKILLTHSHKCISLNCQKNTKVVNASVKGAIDIKLNECIVWRRNCQIMFHSGTDHRVCVWSGANYLLCIVLINPSMFNIQWSASTLTFAKRNLCKSHPSWLGCVKYSCSYVF